MGGSAGHHIGCHICSDGPTQAMIRTLKAILKKHVKQWKFYACSQPALQVYERWVVKMMMISWNRETKKPIQASACCCGCGLVGSDIYVFGGLNSNTISSSLHV
ncbi:hypothetical protein O6P43_011918 [Quillaja saponaria]|uniref:Uncharacterized protein n=1 Tax=Quillaja saponaria TaxID=32244 RepID=A0AAD7PTI2_QUISA|nr:hypothetical protein O6P43_011918 [Quillaja saponaria]